MGHGGDSTDKSLLRVASGNKPGTGNSGHTVVQATVNAVGDTRFLVDS